MGPEILAVAVIGGAVLGGGAAIYSAEEQKKAARKGAKAQKQQARLQAAREKARMTREGRKETARLVASGASAGLGELSFEGSVSSVGASIAGGREMIAQDLSITEKLINIQRNQIINQATASQISAVGDMISTGAMVGMRSRQMKAMDTTIIDQ